MFRISAALGVIAVAMVIVPVASSTGLEGYWTLDEGRGLSAGDSSVHGNTGTVVGARWTSGRFKSALRFDGVDDELRVSSSSPGFSFLEPPTITVEAWLMRSGSSGAGKHIVAKGDNGCFAASYGLYTGQTGGLLFYVQGHLDGGSFFVASPDAGPGVWDGKWHHVAGTFDGTSVRLYVDGTQVGEGTLGFFFPIGYGLFPSNDLLAGRYDGCGATGWDGAIDEVRVWDRALGTDEVSASAAMGSDSADELGTASSGDESIVFTSHFATPGGPIVLSIESSSGQRTIASVEVEASKKGGVSCGGTPCPIVPSNGNRTATLTVSGPLKAHGRLRVTLDNGSTVAANVLLK